MQRSYSATRALLAMNAASILLLAITAQPLVSASTIDVTGSLMTSFDTSSLPGQPSTSTSSSDQQNISVTDGSNDLQLSTDMTSLIDGNTATATTTRTTATTTTTTTTTTTATPPLLPPTSPQTSASSVSTTEEVTSQSLTLSQSSSVFLDLSETFDQNSTLITDLLSSVNETTTLSFDVASMTAMMTGTMMTTEEFATSLLPSSVIPATSPSVSTTPKSTTTTTPNPINQAKCRNNWVPTGVDTTQRLIAPGVVEYTCKPGFKESGVGVKVIECLGRNWTPNIPLECEPIKPEPQPVQGMPKWIPILAILLVAVLATALLGVLVLALWVCRANYFRTSIIVNQSQPPPPPQAEVQASKPSTPKKAKTASRRWPWRGPSKPPPGHFGLDGVAWTVSPDDSILPVKRRF